MSGVFSANLLDLLLPLVTLPPAFQVLFPCQVKEVGRVLLASVFLVIGLPAAQVATPNIPEHPGIPCEKIIHAGDGLVQLTTLGGLFSDATHLEVAVAPNRDILAVWTSEVDAQHVSVEAAYLSYGVDGTGVEQWTCSPTIRLARYSHSLELARVTKADVECVTDDPVNAVFAVAWGRARWFKNNPSPGRLECAIVTQPTAAGAMPGVEQAVPGIEGFVLDASLNEAVGNITPSLVWRESMMAEREFGVVYSHLVSEDSVNDVALLDIRWADASIPAAGSVSANSSTLVSNVPAHGDLYARVNGSIVVPEIVAVEDDLLLLAYEEAPPTMTDGARVHLRSYSWLGFGTSPLEVASATIEPTSSDTLFRRPVMSVSPFNASHLSLAYYELDGIAITQTAHLQWFDWTTLTGTELTWPAHLIGASKVPSPIALTDSTICFIHSPGKDPLLSNLLFDGITTRAVVPLSLCKRAAAAILENADANRDLLVVGAHSGHETYVAGTSRPYLSITLAEL